MGEVGKLTRSRGKKVSGIKPIFASPTVQGHSRLGSFAVVAFLVRTDQKQAGSIWGTPYWDGRSEREDVKG